MQCAQAVLRGANAWRLPDRDVVTAIYQRWLMSVSSLDPAAYATTLLVAACDDQGHVRIFQLGDGLILTRAHSTGQVITPDRTGFGNQTQALGVDRSWSAWTTATVQLRHPGDFVLLMTDGVSDDVDRSHVGEFAATVHREVVVRTRRGGRSWLANEMTHWATPGHTDDKTMVMIFRG